MIRIDASDARRFAVLVKGDAQRVAGRLQSVTAHYGQLLQSQVQANASGRPGPRAPTGSYRRSITLDLRGGGASWEAEVGSNADQARRLELGFVGVDAAGRHYPSKIQRVTRPGNRSLLGAAVAGGNAELGYPLPHYGPALDVIGPRYAEALNRIVDT
jgi:hypothetical protein